VDGLFVQAHGIQIATFDPGNFGVNQCGAVFEVLRAILRPDVELSLMKGQSLQMLLALVARRGVAACGSRQRAVQLIFGCLERQIRGRYPPKRLGMRGALDSACVVAGKKARLHLADPIGPFGILQTLVVGESTLDRRLVELPMVKTSECLGQSTQGPYEAE